MSNKNIVIDRGNSSIKVGVFEHTALMGIYEFIKPKELIDFVAAQNPGSILLSSVVKKSKKLTGKLKEYAKVIRLNHKTRLPFVNDYETPETLGPDRIAAVAGVYYEFKGENCLVIDAGTCVTYDFINSSGHYLGGAISPGLKMRAKALNIFTSKLPYVEFNEHADVLGTTTNSCIESGVVNGLVMEIEGMIAYYRRTFGEIKVVICGGDSNFFESKLKGHIFAVANLVLSGLNRILLYNIETIEDFN